MGSKSSSSATSFDVLAFIRASDLVSSSSTSQAYGPKNGVYWYYYGGRAVGFASSSSICVGCNYWGDWSGTDCSSRLSWHLTGGGGWRSGCTEYLNSATTWRKLIYSCPVTALTHCFDCVAGSYGDAAGASACISCPDSSTSRPGSSSASECFEEEEEEEEEDEADAHGASTPPPSSSRLWTSQQEDGGLEGGSKTSTPAHRHLATQGQNEQSSIEAKGKQASNSKHTATVHVQTIASSSPRALLHPTTRHPPHGWRSVVDNQPLTTKGFDLSPLTITRRRLRGPSIQENAPSSQPASTQVLPEAVPNRSDPPQHMLHVQDKVRTHAASMGSSADLPAHQRNHDQAIPRHAMQHHRKTTPPTSVMGTSSALLALPWRGHRRDASVREDWATRKSLKPDGAMRQLLSTDTGVELYLHEQSVCGTSKNTAKYGPCIASEYRSLSLVRMPDRAYPGRNFLVQVIKRDAYNQTMTSDSSSSLTVLTAKDGAKMSDPAVRLAGQVVGELREGKASFEFSVAPGYQKVLISEGVTSLLREPQLYFQGSDVIGGRTMESDAFIVTLFSGKHVCQPGYILSMGSIETSSDGLDTWRIGSCSRCRAGTYALSPLTQTSAGADDEPSCLPCPAGGVRHLDRSVKKCV